MWILSEPVFQLVYNTCVYSVMLFKLFESRTPIISRRTEAQTGV